MGSSFIARAVGSAFLMLLGAGGPAHSQSLNLLIWEGYISPVLIERWKALTHSDINQIYFDSGDKRDAILSNPNSMVDLTIIDESRIGRVANRGLLSELSRDKLPNLALIGSRWQEQCGRYGAAYFWGTSGILYRSDKVPVHPTSWRDLLQPADFLKQHIAMIKDDDDLLAVPLHLLNKPANTDNIDALRGAFAILKAQAPAVLTYDYIITIQQNPAFEDKIYMALGNLGDQAALNRDPRAGNAWHFVTPREGSNIWMDCIAVVDRSPRRQLAIQFINFLNEPRNAAENARYLKMPTPNTAALPLLPDAMLHDAEIYPAPDVIARSSFRGPLPEATSQLRRRIVSAVMSANDPQ